MSKVLWLVLCWVTGVSLARADDTLPSAVTWEQVAELVRKAGPSVRVARAETRAAEARVEVAGVLPNPEISYMGYSRTRGNSAAINGTQHQAQIEQPIMIFGQRFAREKYAKRAADAIAARAEVSVLYALSEARHAFVTLAAAQDAVAVLKAADARMREILRIVSERAAAGAQSAYDVLRVEVEHAQLLSRLEQARADLRAASATLGTELGRPGWLPRAATTLEAPGENFGIWERLANEHPVLLALERDLETQHAAIELAQAERRPIPSLTAGGYWTTDGTSSSVVFGASLPLPLFNTGRASINAAKADLSATQVVRDVTEAQARARYEAALATFAMQRSAYESYQRGVMEKLPKLREMAEAAYKGGAANVLVLVDASRSATEVEVGRLSVLEALLHAEAKVLAAAGQL